MSERKDPLDDFLRLRVSSPVTSPALPAASLLKGDLQARLLAFQKGRAAKTPASNESLPAEENKQISLPPLPLLPQSYLMPLANLNDTLSRLSSVNSNSGRVESKPSSFTTSTSDNPLDSGHASTSSSSSSSSKSDLPLSAAQQVPFHPQSKSTGAVPAAQISSSIQGVSRSSSLLKQSYSDSKVPQLLPHTSPLVLGRLELSKKPSLSQRRGMKLDVSGLNNSSNSTPLGPLESLGPPSNLKLNKAESPLRESTPQGLFSNYSKYVDIKEGKLNFAGKASLHAQGVDFLSGSSFRISKDQLEFVEELGRGNYGTVSKVIHKPTGVLMAMKEVRLELEESKFTQILMELDILHKCVSPYIVDFYGAFFVEGGVFMCMEYMDGGLLDKIFGGEGVELETALAYITECVIRGLKELKDEHNIIHRDVKPTNILLNTAGRVKLCDFGVSGNLVALMARTNIGCQLYMAPERIWLKQPVDSASSYTVQLDVWLLGLTILEISLGHYPYPPETYDNMFLQLTAIVDGEPPKLDSRFLKAAQLFVKQCLTKNPDLRPHYATLLQNPWLLQYRDSDPHMSEIVINRLKAIQEKTPLRSNLINESKAAARQTPANVPNVRLLLKEKVRAPALHRGGLPMQGRFRK